MVVQKDGDVVAFVRLVSTKGQGHERAIGIIGCQVYKKRISASCKGIGREDHNGKGETQNQNGKKLRDSSFGESGSMS